MTQNASRYLLVYILIFALSPAAQSAPTDGILLEGSATASNGGYHLRTGIDMGRGMEPVTIPGATQKIEVGYMRIPFDVRMGLTDNIEVGGGLGIEWDRGGVEVNGKALFNGVGIERIRLLGKWNFEGDMAAMAEFSFLGNNELYYSFDSFDFGLKFIFAPNIGGGNIRFNVGMAMKGGDPKISTAVAIDYRMALSLGVGYSYPFSDRVTGIAELAMATSSYKGGAGVATESLLDILFGGRYFISEDRSLVGGLGIGLQDGSPGLSLKGAFEMKWGMWGGEQVSSGTEAGSESSPKNRWEPASRNTAEPPSKTPAASGQPPVSPATSVPVEPPQPTKEELVKQIVTQATSAFERGEYPSAATLYESALKLKEDDWTLHYNLATSYFILKRYSDAKVFYKNTITLSPLDPDAHLYLGYTYYYLNDPPSALYHWKKVVEIHREPQASTARENIKSIENPGPSQ